MRDHHVDRPEVEAGQPAQLTGTNRSIGLSVRTQRQKSSRDQRSEIRSAIRPGRQPSSGGTPFRQEDTPHNSLPAPGAQLGETRAAVPLPEVPGSSPGTPFGQPRAPHAGPLGGLAGLVAIARGKTPDPIPNSAVKTLSADGTAPQGVEE